MFQSPDSLHVFLAGLLVSKSRVALDDGEWQSKESEIRNIIFAVELCPRAVMRKSMILESRREDLTVGCVSSAP